METRESTRLRALVETGIAINSELSLDGVLQRIVEAAARVTGAQYAALGVIDPSGLSLERFITHGIDEETRTIIGDLPHGRGVLGALITDAHTLRLRDLAEDPRSVGFPPGHPPMKTFLGTPIMLRGVAYGNLYLTEKHGGIDFDEEDEELVSLLSAQAAVAIENARLYESATAWSRQLESLQEISAALVGELDLPKLLQLVVERLRDLIDARVVAIALPVGNGLRVEAIAADDVEGLLHDVLPLQSKAGAVLLRGRSEAVDALLDDPEVVQDVRRLAVELRPKALDDFGLVPALERLIDTFREATGISVEFEARLGGERLPSEVETTLYRIVQESLTNIAKHAGARRVSVLLLRKQGAVSALVEDDGHGFDPAERARGGIGLDGMRERLTLLEGRFEIESSRTGTSIVAEVPLP